MRLFGDFDVSGFWLDDDYARKHVGAALDDTLLRSVEQELGAAGLCRACQVEERRDASKNLPSDADLDDVGSSGRDLNDLCHRPQHTDLAVR